MIRIADLVADWASSPFGAAEEPAWLVTSRAPRLVAAAIRDLPVGPEGFEIRGDVAIHASAAIEGGAVVKGPAIIGANAFVAAGAYLRGGVFVDAGCTVGPACELKSTFMLKGSTVAHLSFVGDSILGARVNIEAGAVVANHRNELDDEPIRFVWRGTRVDTGVDKFGALIGDDCRIGANAVVAPGAVLEPGTRVARLGHVDQLFDPTGS